MASKKPKPNKKTTKIVQRPHAGGVETRRRILTAAQLISRHTPRQNVLNLLQVQYKIGDRQAERYYEKGQKLLKNLLSSDASLELLGAITQRLMDMEFTLSAQGDPIGMIDSRLKVTGMMLKTVDLSKKHIKEGSEPLETQGDSGPDLSDDLAALLKNPPKKR